MSDQWVKEAERRGNEADDYQNWVDANEDVLLEQYKDKLNIDDIPEDFIQSEYENYCNGE
jgi:hypothetical protein